MKLWCITTVDESEILEGNIFKLLLSISTQDTNVVLVLRDVRKKYLDMFSEYPQIKAFVLIGKATSSEARNAGLLVLKRLKPFQNDLVCFPDDDCFFWPNSVSYLFSAFNSSGSNFIGGRYGEAPPVLVTQRQMSPRDALTKISAVGIFLTWELCQKVGGFNNALGAGSSIFPNGEDNDYSIRAWRLATNPIFHLGVSVHHKIQRDTSNRSPQGVLTVLALHPMHIISWSLSIWVISKSVLSDLQRYPISNFNATKSCLMALKISKLQVARKESRKSMKLFTHAQEVPSHILINH